ncbi:3-oxoacyl-[acyl-carrier-protein] synthase III C-terminal domain-containing protein [Eilatimonas milleporae]|uniref:3-hydroxy-3-methylglutaryl CoA synthase n=1 Tax=Eilatimonas milleporae TaxID=911205 RepID=A0A3M0CT00_9PROT|nr:3-oxoacyl-[acyl-carrier-protein] synthase III C-terminal domain-containing protein [Eilatimonas milleporae]RMB12107.1 3-hydroxy-3-methylglutaryl CoA synthase [Eilatimonas milleporae]
MTAFGILDYGAYLPRRRCPRASILDAVGWAQPGLKALAKGERSFAAWDEDAVTMAVEAARGATAGADTSPELLCFATTTAPFLDRQNAGIIAAALDLPQATQTMDMGGSQRAASSALINAWRQRPVSSLVVAADTRPTQAASVMEMLSGDGAAAFRLGEGTPLAVIEAHACVQADIVDHYRTAGTETDYVLEERWYRDMGLARLAPAAVSPLLDQAQITADDVDHLIAPLANPALARAVAKSLGVDAARIADSLFDRVGHTGTAHALLMLAGVLDTAAPGDRILITAFGQGCDAVLLRVTDAIADAPRRRLARWLGDRHVEDNYMKFLAARGVVDLDWGMRAERDNRTAHTVAYNKSRDTYGLVGGYCRACGTPQYPRSRRCVAPDCGKLDTQDSYGFSERSGTVKSFTEDWMAFTREPPLIYGNVSFTGGGNILMEMCDFAPGAVSIGTEVEMRFRIKDFDQARGFRRYFWKAAPAQTDTQRGDRHG